MGDSRSIDQAISEIEALESALRHAKTPREVHENDDDQSPDEDLEDAAYQFQQRKEERIAQIQGQLARLYSHLDYLRKQQAARDGIPITKDSAILLADVGFGISDSSSASSGFLPTDKCLAIICPYEGSTTESERNSRSKNSKPSNRSSSQQISSRKAHSPSREEFVPRNMCAKIELVDRYQVVHQTSGRITVQGWSFVRPGIGSGAIESFDDHEEDYYEFEQEAEVSKVSEELQSLNELIDSIESEQSPEKSSRDEVSISDQISELLAMDAEIASKPASGSPSSTSKVLGDDNEMFALKNKLMRNRERLRQMRASAGKGASASTPPSPGVKEELISMDMKKLRMQLRDLKHSSMKGQNSPHNVRTSSGSPSKENMDGSQVGETSSPEGSDSDRRSKVRVFASEEERLQERERIISELNTLKEQLEDIRSRRNANANSLAGFTRSNSSLSGSSGTNSVSSAPKQGLAENSGILQTLEQDPQQSQPSDNDIGKIHDDNSAESEEYDC